jgi:uncharacterized protein (DUF58 family)
MLSQDIIKQIRHIQLKAGRLVTDALAGEYSSAFKGLGMEFEKVREYVEGDDVRMIDWNVTARMNTPFVKIFREERELTLMLLIDVSSSLEFGTSGKFKNELAAELAAVLAFLAIKNNDNVGLIIFSDHVEQFIPPQKGRAHVWRIIRTVLTHQSKGKKTDINTAFDYLVKVCRKKSMCFLLSDFHTRGFEKSLSRLSKRHEIICVSIADIREEVLASCGVVEFIDAETDELIVLDTSDPKTRKFFEEDQILQTEQFVHLLRSYGVDYFEVTTHESVMSPLVRYMRKRERRLR